MSIQEFHRLFLLVADKTVNQHWSHEDIDDFAEVAQQGYFSMLIGNLRKYQRHDPSPAVVDGKTNRVKEELNPFKVSISYIDVPFHPANAPYGLSDGILALPADFEHMDAVTSMYLDNGSVRERPVDIVSAEEWGARSDSSIVAPTKRDAICMFDGRGGTLNSESIEGRHRLRFLPENVTGKVRYYRKPVKPLYSYTVNQSTRVETFDASSSVDLEWGHVASMNILVRALSLAGVPGADQSLVQAMTFEKMNEE